MAAAYAGLDVRSEVYLGSWTAVPLTGPGSIRNSSPVAITRGRQNLKSQMTPSQATFTVDNRDGRWTIRNPNGAWYGQLVQNTPIRFSVPSSLTGIPAYLRLETDTASYASTPDSAPLQVTSGTLSIRIDCKITDWISSHVLFAKWGTTTATQAWALQTNSDGTIGFAHTDSGLTGYFDRSTLPLPYFGQRIALRVDYNITAKTVTFYTAPTMSGTWTQLGGVILTQAASQETGAGQIVQAGQSTGSIWPGMFGEVYEAAVLWFPTPVLVHQVSGTAVAGSITLTLPGSTTAGNYLVVCVQTQAATNPTVTGITLGGAAGNFAQSVFEGGATDNCRVEIWGDRNCAGGQTSVVVSLSGSGTVNAQVLEFSGLDPNSTVDVSGINLANATFSTWFAGGTAPTSQALEVAVGMIGAVNGSANTITGPGAPWTNQTQINSGTTHLQTLTGYNILSAVGAQSYQGSFSVASTYSGCVATFRAGATVLADAVFTSQTIGATSFTDGQGNTWTLAGTSELSGRSYRFHGELAAGAKAGDPSQRNLYTTTQAGGIMRRLSQAQTPADSPMKRAYVRLPSTLQLAAYWPGEDAAGATQIGAAVGIHPMTNAGMTMASSSVFASSAALPVLNGATYSAVVDPNSVTWTDNVVRFLFAPPAAGEVDNCILLAVTCQGGPVSSFILWYRNQFGGTFNMQAFGPSGTLLHDTGVINTFSLNGNKQRVSANIKQNGANLDMEIEVVQPGASVAHAFTATSIATGSVSPITGISGGTAGITQSVIGHWSVQGKWDTLFDLSGPLNAWFGETAGARYTRLCGEEGISCRVIGPPDLSQPMGNQTQQTIVQLLQDIENTDQGLMFETRQVLGLGYVTNWALCNQPPTAVADFSRGQVDPKFSPTADDTLVTNDVTATTPGGSTARQVLASGAMSVNSPPSGVGRFDTSIQVNPQWDAALANLVGWYLHIRTADDDRYPAIPFRIAHGGIPQSVGLLDVGSYLELINTPLWVPPGPIKQIVVGMTEQLGPQPNWDIALNGIPEMPYEVATADDLVLGHADTSGSALAVAIGTGDTTMQVATTAGPAWTTNAADLPFDVKETGEVMTVTAIGAVSTPILFSDDFETGVSGWTPTNCTFAQSGAQHHTGSFSGLMTPVSSPSFMWVTDNTHTPMPAGGVCQCAGWLFSTGTPTCYLQLQFFDANNNFLGQFASTPTALVASTWTFMATTAAPALAGTNYCQMQFVVQSPGTTTVFVDGAGLNVSAQQFTITRSVNGIVKAHAVGEDIRLAHPMIAAL